VVSVDPLEEPSLPLERLNLSHFWRGIGASLADKWSTGSGPSLFPPLGGRMHPAELVLLICVPCSTKMYRTMSSLTNSLSGKILTIEDHLLPHALQTSPERQCFKRLILAFETLKV